MEIKEAKSEEDIGACFEAVKILRPNLKTKEEFISRVILQQSEGYRLVYINDKETGQVVSIAGFRICNFLWSGKALYIDDICTLSTARGKGYAKALIQWIVQLAKDEKCERVDLDSGYTRNDAHRFYLNSGFVMHFHHFSMKL